MNRIEKSCVKKEMRYIKPDIIAKDGSQEE
jgi:hypothetical protein